MLEKGENEEERLSSIKGEGEMSKTMGPSVFERLKGKKGHHQHTDSVLSVAQERRVDELVKVMPH